MIEIELFRWWIQGRKGRELTRYRMTREIALERFPGATPDLATREVRSVADTINQGASIVAAGGGSRKN